MSIVGRQLLTLPIGDVQLAGMNTGARYSWKSGNLDSTIRQYRASAGPLVATALSLAGQSPDEWTITRLARGAVKAPRVVAHVRLEALRAGGFGADSRRLASVIRAGLAGRLG
jgi:hypothetical protein